jgi:hypothetical protein
LFSKHKILVPSRKHGYGTFTCTSTFGEDTAPTASSTTTLKAFNNPFTPPGGGVQYALSPVAIVLFVDAFQGVAVPCVVPIVNEPLVSVFTRKTYGVLSTTAFPFVTRFAYEIVTTARVEELVNGFMEVNVGTELEIGDIELKKGTKLDAFDTLE